MMEWLRAVLEKAEIKDGVLDIDKLMSTVNLEAPKNVMSKQDYNSINNQLKVANDTITELKKNNTDNAELQEKIKTHETTIKEMEKTHKEEMNKLKKESVLKDALRTAKAKHEDLLLSKIDFDKLQVNADSSVSGVEEQLKVLKEKYEDMFETDDGDSEKGFWGVKSHEAKGNENGKKTQLGLGASFAKEANDIASKNAESKFFN